MTSSGSHNPVLVLGGGIAGIATALELTRLGLPAVLVEKSPFFGGRVAHLCCKATHICQKCGACLLEDQLRELFQAPNLRLYPYTTLTAVQRQNGLFHLTLRRRPRIIDPYLCVDCGLCYEECPAASQGAIITAPSPLNHPRYAVVPENCLYFLDGSCQVCQRVCPPTVKAIDLTRSEEMLDLAAAAIVVATGYAPADPCSRPHYGYGCIPQVLSGWELEERLRHGAPLLRPDGASATKVAFIQCVGSRDQQHPYCSQVCCPYALRLGRLLQHRHPELEVTVFYMDLQNVGLDNEKFHAEARNCLKVIRALPGSLTQTLEGDVQLRYLHHDTGLPQSARFDVVVLAVGMAPGPDTPELAEMLGLDLSPLGFFRATDPDHRSLTSQPGIFLAGAAEGPKDIAASLNQAISTAWQVSRYLKKMP